MRHKIIAAFFLCVNVLLTPQYVFAASWFTTITKLTSTQFISGDEAVKIQGEWYIDTSGELNDYLNCSKCQLNLFVVVCKDGQFCRPGDVGAGAHNVLSSKGVKLVNEYSWSSAMKKFVKEWGNSGNINWETHKFPSNSLVCAYFGIAEYQHFRLAPNGNGCLKNPPIDTWCSVNWPREIDLGTIKAGVEQVYDGHGTGSISCNKYLTSYVSLISKDDLNGLPVQFTINNKNIKFGQEVMIGSGRSVPIDLRATVVGKFNQPGFYQANAVFIHSFF